jgi:hypothetical protein
MASVEDHDVVKRDMGMMPALLVRTLFVMSSLASRLLLICGHISLKAKAVLTLTFIKRSYVTDRFVAGLPFFASRIDLRRFL